MRRRVLSHRSPNRQGTIYVATVGVAFLVAIIAGAAMHSARIDLREVVVLDEMQRARTAALSGTEYTVCSITRDAAWRTTQALGLTDITSTTLGLMGNTASWDYEIIDPDGDLTDDDSDPITLRVVGYAGDSRCVIETLVQPTGNGLNCLQPALHSQSDVVTNAAITNDAPVSSNGDVDATSGLGSISGDAQAAGTVSGNVGGNSQSGMTPLDMPDTETLFDYYLDQGTFISLASISGHKIDKCVLSGGNNPYGTGEINAQGIYVIDCGGLNPAICNCRVAATLVLVNVGSAGLTIDKTVYMTPAIANFPVLLVDGDVQFSWDGDQTLNESDQSVNFNPAHTPYNDISDTDQLDVYPGWIEGLVYCTGNLSVTNFSTVKGVVVVGGQTSVVNTLNLTHDSIFYDNPPPGFTDGSQMEIVPGTWKRVEY